MKPKRKPAKCWAVVDATGYVRGTSSMRKSATLFRDRMTDPWRYYVVRMVEVRRAKR